MGKVQVLLDQEDRVLGTLASGNASGGEGPEQVGFRPNESQRVVELELEDSVLGLDADELHRVLKEKHLG